MSEGIPAERSWTDRALSGVIDEAKLLLPVLIADEVLSQDRLRLSGGNRPRPRFAVSGVRGEMVIALLLRTLSMCQLCMRPRYQLRLCYWLVIVMSRPNVHNSCIVLRSEGRVQNRECMLSRGGFRERLTGVCPAHLRTGVPWCTALFILTAQLEPSGTLSDLVSPAPRRG